MHADLCIEFNDNMDPETLAQVVHDLVDDLKDKGVLVKFDVEVIPLDKAQEFLTEVVKLQGVAMHTGGGKVLWDPKPPADKTY